MSIWAIDRISLTSQRLPVFCVKCSLAMKVPKKRVLFVAQEFSPYLAITEFSEFINKLAVEVNASGFEVRCIMPRFGTINDRRYRLHEVLRLTGINIYIDGKDYDLHIKVASLPHSRLQVYFLDNNSFFGRESVFSDALSNEWYADNGLRSFFFCRGVIETVKKFRWPPDIIHCAGWFVGFLPFLIRKSYRKDPIFSNAKIISSIYESGFEQSLEPNITDIIKKNMQLKEKQVSTFYPLDYTAIVANMISNSNNSIVHRENIADKNLLDNLQELKDNGKKVQFSSNNWETQEIIQSYDKYL